MTYIIIFYSYFQAQSKSIQFISLYSSYSKLESVDIYCVKNSEKLKFNRQTKSTSRYAPYNPD